MDILLVDDDSFNQDLACMLLVDAGHQVTVADNGWIALEKLAQQDFEVVFLDMEMPVLDGIETARIIRSCQAGSILPEYKKTFPLKSLVDRYKGKQLSLIVMTGNNDEESRARCREAGIDEFLAKPYSLEDFKNILLHCRDGVTAEEKKMDISAFSNQEEIQTEELVRAVYEHMKNTYPLEDEQLRQLVQESLKSVQQAMVDIEEGINNRNLVVVAAASHRLKGTLLGMGLETQMELARTLELSAKAQKQQESEKLAGELAFSASPLLRKGAL